MLFSPTQRMCFRKLTLRANHPGLVNHLNRKTQTAEAAIDSTGLATPHEHVFCFCKGTRVRFGRLARSKRGVTG